MQVIRDIGFWNGLRSIVRFPDPIIAAPRELEADTVFVSGVYRWFRWLRYHAAYDVTSSEQEEQETVLVGSDDAQAEQETTQQYQAGIELLSDTVDLISASVSADHELENTAAEGENVQDGDNYENVESLQLDELQTFFRGKIRKRWDYIHTNAMGIAFMLDPTMDLDDLIGCMDPQAGFVQALDAAALFIGDGWSVPHRNMKPVGGGEDMVTFY
ncbi:hypothetical protein PC129_g14288 [Phytophthora cactorum]|uniref:Uncharacterized protein n=1 Tax=Phytophthora cactorum TaxID=29920 RepID=A0A329S157_9STRA|nr:hypothetical protein Pcac1_g26742 [Phytophthora cactorum]KAG2810444.1 hypothetical protein PC112_g16054 [Phytophthora cactorum]KAG2811790.1 hypothetical protein PC111_g15075 [Phytophthora cactorum]KAG2851203.1 hypothetical protein PC113_g16105 [Phytophthora cactorum]KAG2902520.1 hypothetical protein PC115_g15565 [Phytophthora cactorum]